jgi:hypothetical protein
MTHNPNSNKRNKTAKQLREERCKEYQNIVSWILEDDEEFQDWESVCCPECGTPVDSCGDCPNTWCGNSPCLGNDWD